MSLKVLTFKRLVINWVNLSSYYYYFSPLDCFFSSMWLTRENEILKLRWDAVEDFFCRPCGAESETSSDSGSFPNDYISDLIAALPTNKETKYSPPEYLIASTDMSLFALTANYIQDAVYQVLAPLKKKRPQQLLSAWNNLTSSGNKGMGSGGKSVFSALCNAQEAGKGQ